MAYGYDWRQTQQGTSSGTGNVQTLAPTDRTMSAALVSAESNDCRVTVDGSAPSATNGHIVYKGAPMQLVLLGDSNEVLKFCGATAGPAILNVTWGY